MSEVHFSADLDSSKLDAAIKESNKTVGQWAKDVEKAGGQADAGLNKMTKSFKQAIIEQKTLIKSIEADVKRLQKAYDDATAGKAKSAMGEQVGMAKRSLSEEKAQLAKLQQQAIEGNKQEDNSQQSLIKSLSRWAAGIFTVTAAMKIGKAIIASTEDTMHSFERITTAVTSGVGYFFKAIASGDWKNFNAGMDRAIKGAIEYVDAMETLTNKLNEQKIKSSEDDLKIAELRDKTYDKDKKNTGERFAALQQIIALEKDKYTKEAALAKEGYDINLKKAASDSGLSTQQIENFLKEYTSLEKLIDIGKKYNEITNLMRKPGMNAAYVADLDKEREALEGNAAEAGAYVTAIGKVTPEVRKQLSDAAAAANEAAAAFGQKNRRDKMQAAQAWNELWDAWMTEIDEMNKVWEERNNIGKKIAEQEKLLNDAIAEGSGSEIKAIGLRIAALKEELKVRETLTKSIVDAMTYQGFVPTTINTSGIKAPSVMPQIKKPTAQKQWEQIQKEMHTLAPSPAKEIKEETAEQKKFNEAKQKQLELHQKIFEEAVRFTFELGKQMGLSEEQQQILGSTLDMFTSLAEGNYIGAATSLISGLMAAIPSEAARFQAQIDQINKSIEKQNLLIQQSERAGGQQAEQQKLLDQLKAERDAIQAQIEKDIKKMNSWINLFGSKEKAQADYFKQIDALDKFNIQIQEAQQKFDDLVTGGITQNSIADAIAQGFQEGKTSVDDFATYMNDILSSAVMDIFKQHLLTDITSSGILDYIQKSLSDNILSPEEKVNIDKQMAAIGQANQAFYNGLTSAIPSLNNNIAQSGMVGTLQRSITEETGTEWVGLARRQADDLRLMRDYSKLGVNHLVGIEANTYNTVLRLDSAIIELQNIAKNTKQLYTVGP